MSPVVLCVMNAGQKSQHLLWIAYFCFIISPDSGSRYKLQKHIVIMWKWTWGPYGFLPLITKNQVSRARAKGNDSWIGPLFAVKTLRIGGLVWNSLSPYVSFTPSYHTQSLQKEKTREVNGALLESIVSIPAEGLSISFISFLFPKTPKGTASEIWF